MNLTRAVRRVVRSALISRGYDIVRPAYGVHDNAFEAQRHLLGDVERPVVFDVGANVGQSALEYTRWFPAAEIYSFEPLPESFARLAAAGAENPRIHAVQSAVIDRSGSTTFHANERSSTNSVLVSAPEAGDAVDARLMQEVARLEVRCTALDEFCQEHGIERVDLLKLDIQGAEVLALRGARRLLSESRVRLVYTEALFAPLYEGQADFWSISELLRAAGYRLYGLFDMNYGRNGLLAWADALWISPTTVEGGKS